MTRIEFKKIRSRLGKTQKEMAQLIGTSIKAVHSYEQGWRQIPHHVERQMLFLVFKSIHGDSKTNPCWERLKCPEKMRRSCPAWEFKSGDLCWFISGTICSGAVHKNWQDKIAECRRCPFFIKMFQEDCSGEDSGDPTNE